jgi:Flp pilus assembly protein TadG
MSRPISRSVGIVRRLDTIRRLKPLARVLPDRRGVTILEFAIAAPVMLTLAIGTFKFGTAMMHQVVLTNAAAQGATALALSRGTTTPYTTTTTAINNAASSTLTTASITTTVTINGTACSTNTACSALMTAGVTAVVRTTYPCDLSVMGINYKSSCTITAQTAQMVQ